LAFGSLHKQLDGAGLFLLQGTVWRRRSARRSLAVRPGRPGGPARVTGDDAAVVVLVEIPRGGRNEYEYDPRGQRSPLGGRCTVAAVPAPLTRAGATL
jgi:hypothetical protein